MYLFDQSSGHTKVRDNDIILFNMNVSYGDSDFSLHDTMLQEVGSYPDLLSVGSYQSMNFGDSDHRQF